MSVEWNTSALGIASIALVAIGGVCFLGWKRSGYASRAAALELLRLVLALGGVLTLCQPEYVRSIRPDREEVVVILYDVSRSMQTIDIENSQGLISRQNAIQGVIAPDVWRDLRQNTRFVLEPFSSEEKSAQEATDLNGALERATKNRDDVRAIVVISDGDWNIGESPASQARLLRLKNIPIYSVAVGSSQKLPDLEISSFDLPTFAVVGKPLRIPYTVESSMARDMDVVVELQLPGGDLQKEKLRVPAMGSVRGTMEWRPVRTGDEKLTIRLVPEAPEKILDNNELTANISIRNESLRVLMIESSPRWEYRYTRNALERDPGVDVHCLMLHPEIGEVGDGRGYLHAFPALETLMTYDVVFLGDVGVGSGQLTLEQCAMLRQLVETQAGGLVLMPGFHGYQATLASSPLNDLFPVDLDLTKAKGIGASRPAQLQLTEAGLESLLTRLESNQADNAEVWRSLPGFYWYAAVERARPGSQVLAIHSKDSTRFGRTPLIVTRTFGTGKVLFMGTDGAWRWRKGVEDLYHYRYWGQVVRWMAYQRTMSSGESIRMFYVPDRPKAGDRVTLHCNAMGIDGEPLQKGTIQTQIVSPSGNVENIQLLKASGEAWGLFSGTFQPEEGGVYQATTVCRETQATITSVISVEGRARERIGQPMRLDVLGEISQITGGQCVPMDRMPELLTSISRLPEPAPIVQRIRLWSHPLWGACLFMLFGVFWVGRKWAGLM